VASVLQTSHRKHKLLPTAGSLRAAYWTCTRTG